MAKFERIEYHDLEVPQRSTLYSAGYDLRTPINFVIPAHSRLLVPTGVTCKLAEDEYLAIVPRSGLALKKGITVLNSPGTVDSDYYPNDIGVILYNTTDEDVEFQRGDKIAQAIIQKYYKTEDDSPVDVTRIGGFGSTGRS